VHVVGDAAYTGERLLVHHEDEPSYDDMTIELRRVINAA